MKIICSRCHKEMGEQEPFQDSSFVQAKCSDCLTKEKAMSLEALTDMAKMKTGESIEIEFEHGYKGVVTSAKDCSEKLILFDLMVAGRKFHCSKDNREEFQQYLAGLPGEDVELAFLFSSAIAIHDPGRRRRKKEPMEEPQELPKGIDSYCVVSVPKWRALRVFDKNAEKADGTLHLLAKLVLKQWIDEGGYLKQEAS